MPAPVPSGAGFAGRIPAEASDPANLGIETLWRNLRETGRVVGSNEQTIFDLADQSAGLR